MFGNQLKAAVEEVGIDTRNLIMDENVHTTLALYTPIRMETGIFPSTVIPART